MSNTRNLNVKQNRSLLFKISGFGQASFHENTFLELFLPNAPLHYLAEHIFGIVTHNYQHKIFNVTLLPTSEAQLPQIVQRYNKPTPLKTQSGNELQLEVRYHSPPTQTVTLHPVPHGITTEEILALTNKWGELSAHEYGRHKTIRAFRNSFLHLQFKNLKINEIPERITINKHFVAVLAPGQALAERCGFCKLQGHVTKFCPSKSSQPRPITSQSNLSKPSYADVTKSFEHPPHSCVLPPLSTAQPDPPMQDSNDHNESADQAPNNVTEDTPLGDDIPPAVKSDQHGCNDSLPAPLENNIPKTPQVGPSPQFNETLFFNTVDEAIDTLDAQEQKLLQNSVELLHLSKNPITNNCHHSPNLSRELTENEQKPSSPIKPKDDHQTKRTYTERNSTSPSKNSPPNKSRPGHKKQPRSQKHRN